MVLKKSQKKNKCADMAKMCLPNDCGAQNEPEYCSNSNDPNLNQQLVPAVPADLAGSAAPTGLAPFPTDNCFAPSFCPNMNCNGCWEVGVCNAFTPTCYYQTPYYNSGYCVYCQRTCHYPAPQWTCNSVPTCNNAINWTPWVDASSKNALDAPKIESTEDADGDCSAEEMDCEAVLAEICQKEIKKKLEEAKKKRIAKEKAEKAAAKAAEAEALRKVTLTRLPYREMRPDGKRSKTNKRVPRPTGLGTCGGCRGCGYAPKKKA